MTAKIPDDLLSAFLDREVTPDEEALARKHLQKSSQARQQFQDYQRLGQLLHELPRRTAPTEFVAAVMQQAERETLLPLDASAGLPSDAQSIRPFRRAWIVSLVGLVATAAAVLVVVNLPVSKDAVRNDAARKDAVAVLDKTFGPRSSQAEPQPAKPISLDSPSPKLLARKLDVDSKMVVAKADGHFRAKRASALARPAAPPLATPPLNVAAAAPLAAPLAARSDKSRMVFPAELKAAREGDVVEALESVGDQVAVVRLTLVNRTASLGGLENLLVRNASRPVLGKEKEQLMKDRFAEKKGSVVVDDKTVSNGPGELICVFVEGSRDELVGVLKEVQNQSLVQRAQLTNAISPAKLAEYAQRPVTTAQHSGAQALSLPHATVDKITGIAAVSSGTASSGTVSSGLGGMGRGGQAAVPQSANDLVDLVQSATTGDADKKPSRPGQQSVPAAKEQAGAAGGKQLIAGTTQRSYQVFFVLDDQSVTESQDKAPAAGEARLSPETKSHVRPRTPVRARRPMRKRVVKPDDDGN
jgi:negative regulator of sigma E activity